jgi:hypothetical protein
LYCVMSTQYDYNAIAAYTQYDYNAIAAYSALLLLKTKKDEKYSAK